MKVSTLVENILRDNPRTRNSDKLLMLEVMASNGLILSEEQRSAFLKMPSTETVRRIRQKLQEDGKYLAQGQVKTERTFKSHRMQQSMPSSKPSNVENILEPPKAISWLDD